jgi:hypothetical protein
MLRSGEAVAHELTPKAPQAGVRTLSGLLPKDALRHRAPSDALSFVAPSGLSIYQGRPRKPWAWLNAASSR